VTAAREALAELDDVLWAARRPDELLATKQELERLRSQMAALDAALTTEIEVSGAASEEAWASAGDYLTAVAGGRRGSGQAWLRTARALTGPCSLSWEALRNGWISPEHAQVICSTIRKLPVEASLRERVEAQRVQDATTLNASELQQAARLLLELLDPEGTAKRDERQLSRTERSAHLNRHLSIIEDGLGGVRLRGRGTVEDAAAIKAALFPLTRPQQSPTKNAPAGAGGSDGDGGASDCDQPGRDIRDYPTRLWDALVETCQTMLDTDRLPESHGAKPRISVTIAYADLRAGLGTGVLETGETLSGAVVRRLSCDADLFPVVLGTAGEVLDVGRAHRLVTAALWRALVARDRHCAFPGCSRPPVCCDAHHIRHWADGGVTSLDNLVLLCRRHHTTVHTTPWSIRLDPTDRRPGFIPPAHLDPEQKPLRHRRPRE
jgi:hypothetical protein